MNYKKENAKNQDGFTLIEMIVAVGVFAIVMLISVSSILAISAAQKRAIAIQNVQDNIRYALEIMAKEIRLGYSFHCGALNEVPESAVDIPANCINGGSSFTFRNSKRAIISYQANALQVQRWDETNGVYLPITSQSVEITRLQFYVVGVNDGGVPALTRGQPRVMIAVEGKAFAKGQNVVLNLQTTVSQRQLDSIVP